MSRISARLALSLLLVLLLAAPSFAGAAMVQRMAIIQTAATISDRSDQSIRTGLEEAFEAAMRSAATMGLFTVRLQQAALLEDAVVVQVLATDSDADDDEMPGSGEESRQAPRSPTRTEL
jgi:hypothetical protein